MKNLKTITLVAFFGLIIVLIVYLVVLLNNKFIALDSSFSLNNTPKASDFLDENRVQNCVSTPNILSSGLVNNSITILLALFAAFISLWQVKSNTISSARIRWIEDLRETISKLYPVTLDIISSHQSYFDYTKKGDQQKADKYFYDYSQNIATFNALSSKAKMQLNSKEPSHKDIEDVLDLIDSKITSENVRDADAKEIENHLKKLVIYSKVIFKTEWDKSKKLFN